MTGKKTKVRTEQVGDKTIPVLVWPNGSHIHLMPWKIDGGQDPAEQLQRWVEAWLDHANQELQRWLNDEIEEATSDLRQHFVTEAERRMKAQNELDEANEQLALVRQQYQDANNRAMGLQLKLDARE